MILSTDDELKSLLADILDAEQLEIPGFAKHQWVLIRQAQRYATSPPPLWIYLLIKALDIAIPEIIKWLKNHHGTNYTTALTRSLAAGLLPWQSSKTPPSPPKSEAPPAA